MRSVAREAERRHWGKTLDYLSSTIWKGIAIPLPWKSFSCVFHRREMPDRNISFTGGQYNPVVVTRSRCLDW
jgi:hypothetical protein